MTATQKTIAAIIAEAASELYKEHAKEIEQFADESEDQKAVMAFSVKIEGTVKPTVTVKLGYAKRVSETRVAIIEDPKQLKFTLSTPEHNAQRELEDAGAITTQE